MRYLDAATVESHLSTPVLIQALAMQFAAGCTSPVRHAHAIPVEGEADGSLLLMPAWQSGRYLGTKLVTVFPGNAQRGQAAVAAVYILFDAKTGHPLVMMDGESLTARRTAATSALAARYLARTDAERLLVVGSGRISRELALTHWQARPALQSVAIYSRDPGRGATLVKQLQACGVPAESVLDLAAAASQADIISVATLSTEPLLFNDWVRAGTHVDLVGAFRHGMREADDALVANCRIVGDTRAGVLAEADDIRRPLELGLIQAEDVLELADLCRGDDTGRRSATERTLFKSVGAALEDLAAAIVVYEAVSSMTG